MDNIKQNEKELKKKELEQVVGGSGFGVIQGIAVIDQNNCLKCGTCADLCAYGAVVVDENPGYNDNYSINPDMCVGCNVCAWDCPAGCITLI